MVVKRWIDQFTRFSKKYRYVLIILLIGLLLLIIPTKKSENSSIATDAQELESASGSSLECRLSALLSRVEGAGDVEVILTIAEGEEIIYQTNDDNTNSDTSLSSNKDTVTVTDANRNQSGLIKQIISEKYQGAIIVCHGAEDPMVRLQIVDAVSRITGLGANCISVLKMK